MKTLLYFLLFFFIGLISFFLYQIVTSKRQQPTIIQKQSGNKQQEFDIAQAPKESKTGIIQSMVGAVKWESRTATEPATLTNAKTIIQQGERLVTGEEGNITVVFESIGSVELFPKSDLSFIQTLPINFVFLQTKGTVTYTSNGKTPISVRNNHLILLFSNGSITVTNKEDPSIIQITVNKGSASAAYNDLQNLSNRIQLTEGERFIFDDSTREGSVD